MILFDYNTSRAQDVPLHLLDGYRGYLMTDDYAGYSAVAAQEGIERMGYWAHARRKFVDAQKVQPKGKTGRADMALNLINKLYGIERDLKEVNDSEHLTTRQQRSQPLLDQLKAWLDKLSRSSPDRPPWAGGQLPGQQLEQAGALRRGRQPADRQQPRRERHPPLRQRPQELAVQRHTQGRHGQRTDLQPDRDCQGQREPYAWLRHVLERLPSARTVEDYEALLPRNCSLALPR